MKISILTQCLWDKLKIKTPALIIINAGINIIYLRVLNNNYWIFNTNFKLKSVSPVVAVEVLVFTSG